MAGRMPHDRAHAVSRGRSDWKASFDTLTVPLSPVPAGPMTRQRLEAVIRAELSGLKPRSGQRGLGDRAEVILAAALEHAAYITQEDQ
jgi:hypothetical protein